MNENKNNLYLYGAITVLGVVIILTASKGLAKYLDSLNPFSDDETDKDIKKAEQKTDELGYFNPSFIKNAPAGTVLLTKKNADIKVRNLWDSVGLVYDEPEKMKAVFSNIITKSQVSHLAKVFKDTHKVDLLTWMISKFDTDEQQKTLTQVLNRLNKLPDYKSDKATSKTAIAVPITLKKQNSLADFMKENQRKQDEKKPVFAVPPFNPKTLYNG